MNILMTDSESELHPAAPDPPVRSSPEELSTPVNADLGGESAAERAAARRQVALAYMLPTTVILIAILLPIVLGLQTLYLRDVFGTHLGMKWMQAEALRQGELPLIDPNRAGGQASLGNPNTVPLYPSNLLYLLAGPIWALNAHFWIHLLIAPFAFYWLARRWRLRREAAWMGGVAYAASGYLLSTMNLYNMIAVAALAPALVAACMALAEERRRSLRFAAVVALWALVVLGGDPMTAAMALLMALGAVALRVGRGTAPWLWVGSALGLGTLVALPQLVEFARILPHTFRGYWGYSAEGVLVASWSPAAALEWLLPLFHGRPDLGYWGHAYSGGDLPLLFSLAPGVLALAMVLARGRPLRHAAWWSWVAVVLGLFMALGSHNPLLGLLLRLPQFESLRLLVKFWLWVAVGGSLLVALGFERLWFGEWRALRRALAVLLVVVGAIWLFLSFGGAAAFGWARARIPAAFGDGFVEQELLRWAGTALVTLMVLLAGLALLRLGRRHPRLLALFPILHLAGQIFFLKPLITTDDVEPYLEPPPLLAAVPAEASVVHGDAGGLFGSPPMPLDRYPDRRLIWFQRQTHEQLYPHAGVRWRRYELNHSPEGLDAFLTWATAQAMESLPDPQRVKILEASGVGRLLISRRLQPLEATDLLELIGTERTPMGDIHVYRVRARVDKARLVGTVHYAPHLNKALEILTAPDFVASAATVVPGADGLSSRPPGRVEWIEDSAELMELEVESPAGGLLVIQRTPLPIYRAEIDGEAVAIQPADLHRIGIEVEAGRHRVRVWAPRTPFRLACLVSLLALIATIGVLIGCRRSERNSQHC